MATDADDRLGDCAHGEEAVPARFSRPREQARPHRLLRAICLNLPDDGHSCGGISEAGEVLDFNSDEITVRTAISASAKHQVLVVDSAKYGRDLPCRMKNVWDYNTIVTEADLSSHIREKCRETGCRIIASTAEDTQ
ncbi:MAG: hypothetical protein AAFX90_18245 [Pseudomonadota bacterium]